MMKIVMWVGEIIRLKATRSKKMCEEYEKMRMNDGEYKGGIIRKTMCFP